MISSSRAKLTPMIYALTLTLLKRAEFLVCKCGNYQGVLVRVFIKFEYLQRYESKKPFECQETCSSNFYELLGMLLELLRSFNYG